MGRSAIRPGPAGSENEHYVNLVERGRTGFPLMPINARFPDVIGCVRAEEQPGTAKEAAAWSQIDNS
jgi:hypothetical protein